MEELKFRHEYKFILNYADYVLLHSRLKSIMEHDKNVGESGEYRIRSLYFDNLYDKALKEKLYGVNNREKFRIRYYNDNFDFIKLEKKSKIDNLCNKVSCPITKKECLKIIDNDLDWMLKDERPLIRELYIKMRTQLLKPKVLVDSYENVENKFVDKFFTKDGETVEEAKERLSKNK